MIYNVEIDRNIESESISLEFTSLTKAWAEFLNQIACEQKNGYPCGHGNPSSEFSEGLQLWLLCVDVDADKEYVLMHYDNRYANNSLSLVCEEDEAVISKKDLMDIIF